MPKHDSLKDRLEELFSSLPPAAEPVPAVDAPQSEDKTAPISLPVDPGLPLAEAAQTIPEVQYSVQAPTISEGMFQTAFNNAVTGMCVTSTDGKFIHVNQALCDLLGYSLTELIGTSFQAFTYPEDLAVGGEAMRAMISGISDRAHIQKRYVTRQGSVIWADLNITLIRQDGKPQYFITLIQDVSETRRTSALLEKRVQELNCLNDIGHKIDERPPVPEFLEWVAKRIPTAFLHPEYCIAAIEMGNQIYGDQQALELPTKTVGGIRVGSELIGWLHVAYTQPVEAQLPHYFVDEESALVGGIVSRVAGYLESHSQAERADIQARQLTVLNEMGRALASLLDVQAICQTVRRYGAQLMDVSNIFIALYDEDSQTVTFPMAYSDDLLAEIPSRQLGHSLTDHIIRTAQPLLLSENVIEQMGQLGIEFVTFADDEPALSWLGVPIQYAERPIGVIAVQNTKIPGLFTERERDLLMAIANQAANSIMVARQFESTQQALAKIQDSQALLQSIVDNSPDWIFVKDRNHRFILANTSFARALGKEPQDFIGKDDLELGFPRETVMGDPEKGLQGYWWDDQRVLDTGEAITQPNELNRVDGEDRFFAVFKTALRDSRDQIWGLLGIARDITQLKHNEQFLTKRAVELTAVAEVATSAATALDPQEVLHNVVDSLKEKFDLYHVHIYTWEPEQGVLVLAAGAGEVGKQMVSQGWRIPLESEQSLVARAARERRGIIVNDVRLDPRFLPNELLPDTAAELAVPLISGNEILGVLDVQSRQVGYFTEEDVRIQTTLAYQVAALLQTAYAFQQAQKALEEAEALYTGSSLITNAQAIPEILNALLAMTALKKMDQASIFMFDHAWENQPPETLLVAAAWDKSGETGENLVGRTLAFDQYPGAAFLERDFTVSLADLFNEARVNEQMRVRFKNAGMRSFLASPLIAGGKWLGVLIAQAGEVIELRDAEIRRLDSLVDQAAALIQNLTLQKQMKVRLEELTALQRMLSREAWMAYRSQTSPEQLGYIYDQLETRSLKPERYPLIAQQFPDGNGGRAANDEKRGDERRSIPRAQPGTYAASLKLRGEAIGVLGVQTVAGRTLTTDEEIFLEAVSEQVAQALERARLLQAMQKAALELQGVADVGTATSTILSPEELLQAVVDMTQTNFGLYHVHIYLLDETGTDLILAAGSGEVGRSMVQEGWIIPVDQEDSIVAGTARSRLGQVVQDVHQQAGFMPNPMLPNTRAELAVPMVVADRLLGVFDVQSDTPGRFVMEDIRIYLTLASQVAIALQNARLYAEQLATVERLRELDNMKSAFLANMSHELRTPLNSILGFTQVLLEGLDGPLTDLMVSDLELIEKNGKHLLKLINDVLDMAKIDAGRLALSPEPTNVYELMDEVMITNASLAREKDLYMELDVDEKQDWMVIADQIRLRQIFINIIGNAIKFTDKGGITVEMEHLSAQTNEAIDCIQIRVRDTGIGIPPGKLEEIFEAFSQVDTSTTRKTSGTGLGLPISRRLVELHNGRLWAESSGIAGEGSTFYLELPVSGPARE